MADAEQRHIDRMGEVYGDPSITALRCFQRYDRNATTDIIDLWGRKRWVTQKQSRVYAILRREAGRSERLTMTAVAQEAHISTSSVSRAILKFQGWGIFAVDVTRGRNGGIRVRLREIGDQLQHYAMAAWARIKRAALNVAFTFTGREREVPVTYLPMDATFSEACDGRCTNLLDCSTLDHTPLAPSRASRKADEERARAQRWARDTIVEIRRLNREEPDWDDYLDKVRASYGL
jgi:hypothetical protein